MKKNQIQKKKKTPIPSAFREQTWLRTMGKVFEGKCPVPWCKNRITVYDFQAGHNIPESKGGKTVPDNLIPICSRCNLSMGDRYTIDEWSALGKETPTAFETIGAKRRSDKERKDGGGEIGTPIQVPVVEPKKSWNCFCC